MFFGDTIWHYGRTNAETIFIIKRQKDAKYGLLINVTPTLKQKMFGDYDNKDEKWFIVQEIPKDKVPKCLMLGIDQILSLIHGESCLPEERKHIFWFTGRMCQGLIDVETNSEEWKRRMDLNFPGWETEEW